MAHDSADAARGCARSRAALDRLVAVCLLLASLSIAGCDAGGADMPRMDAGSAFDAAVDGGTAPRDAGAPARDAASAFDAAVDGGLAPTDAGAPASDAGGPTIDAGVPATDAGVPATDAGAPASDAGRSDAGAFDAGYVPPVGGNTLWIGNSFLRFQASGPYPAYDVPAVVQDLHTASGRGGRQQMRVLAQNGFDLHGWWTSWFGYGIDGGFVSAARAIVEDGTSSRIYDPALEYTALPPGERWTRIILVGTASQFVTMPERWYGTLDSAAVVPNMERWFDFVRSVDPSTEILHFESPVDADLMARQPEVDRLYEDNRGRWGGRIIPVGPAFASSAAARPGLDLRRTLDSDRRHFSPPGVYLAACVCFAVLYGDPTGLPVTSGLDVTASDAAFLQRIAQDAVVAVGSAPR